ncbi:DNA polymerase III subunit alpha [Ameyamaea chiangmaiensis NBRC 103196]|uniref:Error-prone DNA polymerase n=1 Tax=Ameyamaea chiangmaiensis TaxID=442969 RepID=A0A850PGG8_9PROT|nr:error-prone DNA polymerase [Ameyamaea chiangmaiensis]MBS4075523.1 error-prone DNA polymerase [Ameyamaea chiangmaiensis]NVN41520.1 error-prone DNA polymerase [Ameyamaea chiangmaiensis]GBQ69440.1 DNA polymerase III subunit alpha [Ameyamaea chiangmaiensis NBRC 103196]
MTRYAELQVTTYFSFLRGASSPDELFAQARALGVEALGITDHGSLAGLVRAHVAARAQGVRLVPGCRLALSDMAPVLVYPTDRAAYGRLCRLLTIGKARAGKGGCLLSFSDLAAHAEGLFATLLPDEADATCARQIRTLADTFGDRTSLALTLRRRPNDQMRLHALATLASREGVPCVATNDVLYHTHDRRILQDVVTCIRHGTTIEAAGFRRERHADRYLKPPAEMARLFARFPEALARGIAIMEACRFSLDDLVYQYPDEVSRPGQTAQDRLTELTWEGAHRRYGAALPPAIARQLRHELGIIGQLSYAPYFLTVHTIVQEAGRREILCQGRGSAANSAVCYMLGITALDPTRSNLLFERFVSAERGEPPDIDVDFEHDRRDEIIDWIYDHYGRTRAALTAVVSRYRARGALRDVGKVMGLPEDVIRQLGSRMWGWWRSLDRADLEQTGIDLTDRRVRLTLDLAHALTDAPRHLSQHPGGFVLTHDRLDELVPLEPTASKGRQVIEWDKDDIDVLRFMKVDCLALGMLTCLRGALDLLAVHKDEHFTVATIPDKDKPTYDMISRADTIGVFQIESRAQMSMLPRLKPQEFYDLVIEIAIVRPGPIQGDMVHPYLRRRQKLEEPDFLKPELRPVLERTLGVPLFQEQAMQIAMICGGFTAAEADELRRAMATFKSRGTIGPFQQRLLDGMRRNKYSEEFAQRIFRQLEGFGSYGFPESHSASFAILAYASSWVKCHHPDIFLAALLNAQPMGFYAPAQLVRDALAHGVTVRPVCVNASRWDCTLEGPAQEPGKRYAVRLGLRMIKGLSNPHGAAIVEHRAGQPFTDLDDLWRRADVPVDTLRHLASADAFRPAFGLSRREALWAIRGLHDTPLPLFAAAGNLREIEEPPPRLAPMSEGADVVRDYARTGLTLRAHPAHFLRATLTERGFVSCAQARATRDGRRVASAGLVLMRQRPGTSKGVIFMTLEDETEILNIVVWPDIFETYRPAVLASGMIGVRGRLQREGLVVHLVAHEIIDLSALLATVADDESTPGRTEPLDVRARHFH